MKDILINDESYFSKNRQWTIPKSTGSIVILTSHIHDLLIKLIESRESEVQLIHDLKNVDLHNLIIFCTSKYNIPNDHFILMMELKHFRNMIAHDFNSIMETSFNQALKPIMDAYLVIILLVQLIRGI